MPPAQCRLIWYSAGSHIQQLYTGFLQLHRRGLIRLSQTAATEPLAGSAAPHLRDVSGAHLSALLNGELRLHYDCHDAVELNERQLERCDFYFKRSYSSSYVAALPRHREKVFPLGLYYRVLPDVVDLRSVERAFVAGRGWREKLWALVDGLDVGNRLRYSARLRDLEALPDYDLPPKVLFLAAAHDPYARADRSREKIEEMAQVNDTRARCIAVLREALGPQFLGGFIHSPYSRKTYKECLVHDNAITRKRNYVRLLKSFPICIATTGLHGSIGGKFAEYVALGKAIVSERLNFEVPGDLQPGRNYLEFTSPEQCAEQCVRLIENREERIRLMSNNARYYQSHLRPDALVQNTLLQALALSSARASRAQAYHAGAHEASRAASSKPAPRLT